MNFTGPETKSFLILYGQVFYLCIYLNTPRKEEEKKNGECSKICFLYFNLIDKFAYNFTIIGNKIL